MFPLMYYSFRGFTPALSALAVPELMVVVPVVVAVVTVVMLRSVNGSGFGSQNR